MQTLASEALRHEKQKYRESFVLTENAAETG